MLASLAIAKDTINWVIFVAGLCMVECCRRGWRVAQRQEAEADEVARRGEAGGGVRAYDLRGGYGGGSSTTTTTMATKGVSDGGAPGPAVVVAVAEYDLGRNLQLQQQYQQQQLREARLGEQKQKKKNSFMGIRAVQRVPVNLNVARGYATRV